MPKTSFFMNLYPSITIAIPTYNESENIENIIRKFLGTSYPNLLEIIVVDGCSTDGTIKIVTQLSSDSRVKLIINPLKIQAAGLNIALIEAKGDVFLRADAHAEYSSNYIEKCIEVLLNSEADNVGGSQRYVAKNAFQSGVALASRSWLSGIAKYRNPEYSGYADTVFLGCFWKSALIKIAENRNGDAFDMKQVRNQDLELNLKLLEKNPLAIFVSSRIKVWYFPRKNWSLLWQQYFKDGRGGYLTASTGRKKSPLRQKVPFFSLLTLLLLWLFDFLLFFGHLHMPFLICTSLLIVLCFIIPVIEAGRVTIKCTRIFDNDIWRGESTNIPSPLTRFFLCLISLLTMPVAYAVGYSYQLGRNKILQIEGW